MLNNIFQGEKHHSVPWNSSVILELEKGIPHDGVSKFYSLIPLRSLAHRVSNILLSRPQNYNHPIQHRRYHTNQRSTQQRPKQPQNIPPRKITPPNDTHPAPHIPLITQPHLPRPRNSAAKHRITRAVHTCVQPARPPYTAAHKRARRSRVSVNPHVFNLSSTHTSPPTPTCPRAHTSAPFTFTFGRVL